jgi:4-hydroxythreonine-4-phosphate dehydrogenase
MQKVAISIGDINGIGLEIALRSHKEIKKICKPIYCVNKTMLYWGAALLGIDVPNDFTCKECGDKFEIQPGKSTKEAGKLSYESFQTAVKMAKKGKVHGIVTLPINKESWEKAKVPFIGHTDALSDKAIMMLGCSEMFTILYTHHIPLKDVSKTIKVKKLTKFLLTIENSLDADKIAVLGLNPHAGDGGVIGDEDFKIKKAIKKANKKLGKKVFQGPLVPDTAFAYRSREKFKYFVCMYHDQGLIPLKSLYFDESINVSLNAGIIRTSVDHGTAFDIAYKNQNLSTISYINAAKECLSLKVK